MDYLFICGALAILFFLICYCRLPLMTNAYTDKPVFKIAVAASGGGSNAQKIVEHFASSAAIEVALIACNKPEAGVLSIAQQHGIPTLLIERERFFRGDGYVPVFIEHRISLIVLAGFLWKVPQTLITAFPKKIINIHPALLPRYGGKGMYGAAVHEAVRAAGEVETGITIHYVDEQYDHGAVIFQARCAVAAGDDAATIAKKVQQLEHYYYPRVIEDVVKKLTVDK
jgi:phosphoribosylglycinamide formyltransferase-1